MMNILKFFLNYAMLALLKLLSLLPVSINHLIGDALGWLAYHLPIERKKVVDVNLRLCFPELSETQLKDLALRNWKLFGRSITERAYLWLGSKSLIKKMVQVQSDINLNDGRKRLFFSMHLMGIEAGLVGASLYLSENGIKSPITLYIKMKNDFFDQRIKLWRERFGAKMMLRQQNAREFIRAIKMHEPIVISPDMDLGKQDSVFVPFFGVPACTVTSLSRFAKLTGAEVCPIITTLNADKKTYTVHIGKPLENFPSTDEVADTLRLNQFFEEQIKPRPEEYYWLHKRFKNRPEGQVRFYP
jgi:Kdo2-lipid IVA lauroyltransferase/acyltransferase